MGLYKLDYTAANPHRKHGYKQSKFQVPLVNEQTDIFSGSTQDFCCLTIWSKSITDFQYLFGCCEEKETDV